MPAHRSVQFKTAFLAAPMFFSVLLLPTVAIGEDRMLSCPNDLPETSWDMCQGSYTFPNGKYDGEFKGGKRNGQGTFMYSNGNKYVGEFKDNSANGKGTLTTPNGRKYVGEFKNDELNGKGIYTLPIGTKYVGEFKDGRRNGKGTLTFLNGEKYDGEFKYGNRNGQGTYFAANGSIISSGIWADDKFVGAAADQINMEKSGGR